MNLSTSHQCFGGSLKPNSIQKCIWCLISDWRVVVVNDFLIFKSCSVKLSLEAVCQDVNVREILDSVWGIVMEISWHLSVATQYIVHKKLELM